MDRGWAQKSAVRQLDPRNLYAMISGPSYQATTRNYTLRSKHQPSWTIRQAIC